MAGVREKRLNEILLALGCTIWQSDIPSTSNRVIRRLIGPPSPPLSLSFSRFSLSLRYNDPLSTKRSPSLQRPPPIFLFFPLPSSAIACQVASAICWLLGEEERERERKKEKGKACRLQAGRETGWRGSKQADLPPSVSFSPIHFADVACWMTSGAQSCQRREGATTPDSRSLSSLSGDGTSC